MNRKNMNKGEKRGSRKHRLLSLLLVFSVITAMFWMSGCGNEQQNEQETVTEESEIQIGFSLDSFVIERWQKDRDILTATAKDLNATVNMQNANGDLDTQITQIRYLIDKKVDVLVIVAVDCDGLSDVIAEAKKADIKVIAYDRLINNADVDLYISFDNTKVGELMAEGLLSAGLANNKVLMLMGPHTDHNVSMLEAGFRSVMEENNVEILDCMYCDGWKPEYAVSFIEENLDLVQEADGIACGNDSIATSVIRSLSELRMVEDVKIAGQDADLEACQRIVEGTQVMTVYKPVEKLASAAAEYAVALAKGEELSGVTDTINDGTYDVPSCELEPIAVYADNMDEIIIGSGFHTADEVYMNVRSDGESADAQEESETDTE